MKNLFFILLLLFTVSTFAANDVYQFESVKQKHRFYDLTKNLRCLVCQNQNLAESNAALANDLRDEIYVKVKTGFTDEQIIQYLVARYGDFILYKPPVTTATLVLWFAPLVFLLSGLSLLFFYLRQTKPKHLVKPLLSPATVTESAESRVRIGEGIW